MKWMFWRWRQLEAVGMDLRMLLTEVRPGVFRACLINQRTNAIIETWE